MGEVVPVVALGGRRLHELPNGHPHPEFRIGRFSRGRGGHREGRSRLMEAGGTFDRPSWRLCVAGKIDVQRKSGAPRNSAVLYSTGAGEM